MKRKFSVIIFVLLSISTLLIYNIYAQGTGDLSIKKTPSNLTDRQKENRNNVMKKLNTAWVDIKKDLKNDNIDTSEYMQIDLENLKLFSQGEGNISDKEKINSILKYVIYPSLKETPDGSLEPLILVNKDGSKVLFCYKTQEGSNVIKKFIFEDEKWASTSKETKGELPLEINIK